MKLSTLEMKGFKSFADKTTLHFNESITGVVGPNGCGKSNVVDAIRWVLGEQKPTALRTEKMENLIFNGTKARKASGLAEVSLTFDNTRNILATEFSTVTVSRHYFKTGDSEYRINGVPCRLKDIHNLFMDTGISTDSYSIIELGMLDDILHNKDNSRRRLFEQAAGISKYKIRKKETLNKLSATQQDLDRVEDLLFEIENNLKELEKQAKRAHRYQRLKAEYKANSIDLAVLMLQSHKDIYKQLSNQQTYESDARSAIEAEINLLEASIAGKKANLIDKEQALAKLQKDLNNLLNEIRAKEGNNNINRERIRYLEEKEINLNKSIDDAEKIIQSTQNDIGDLEKQVNEGNEKLTAIKKSLQQYLQQVEAVKNEHNTAHANLEEAQKAFKQAEHNLYETDKKIAVNKVRLENNTRELSLIEEDKLANGNKLQPLKEELNKWEQEKNIAQQKLDEIVSSEETLTQKITKLQQEMEKTRSQLISTRRILDAKENEYNLVKNLYENFEGFPESIKYLKKNVASMKHSPLLSDVISATDEYKTAIESYLDPWLNYYIVENVHDALHAVNELSEKDKGRANFFLLSALQSSSEKTKSIDGITAALNVISTGKKYNHLAQHLLQNVFIVNGEMSFEDAIDKFGDDEDVVLLHKSGKVIKGANTITGGSVGLFKGKRIGREKNLQMLQIEIQQVSSDESNFNNQLKEKQSELAQLQSAAVNNKTHLAREALNNIIQNLVATQTRIESAVNTLYHLDEKKNAFIRQIEQMDKETVTLNEAHDAQSNIKEKQHHALIEAEVTYREVSERLNYFSSLYNNENISYHQQQNRYQSVEQNLWYKKTRHDEAALLIENNKKHLTDVVDEIAHTTQTIEVLQKDLLVMYDERAVMESLLSREEETYFGSRGEVAETEDAIKLLQKKKEHVDAILSGIKDKLNDLKVQLAATKERLWVEFQVELESILDNEIPAEANFEELQEKVDAAKKRLENYGDVNPMAIQAYEEMKTRYEFIKNQREDLVNAKTSLLATIQEIDETAKEKFDEAFGQIRDNFKMVFRSLFNEEDDCDLILKDSYDPLEAAIEIVAKPKGKKPQVIDQLSGGEKTLTGMSLLFALYLIKPAPFCILDEVDAPLDDNNIMKFNNMVRKFSDKSQFIIVTHNKRTMTQVDVIYGVTMPEQGISKVVPVDLRALN